MKDKGKNSESIPFTNDLQINSMPGFWKTISLKSKTNANYL